MGFIELLFAALVALSVGLGVFGLSGLWIAARGKGDPELADRVSSLVSEEIIESRLETSERHSRWPKLQALVRQLQPWRRLDDHVQGAGKAVTAVELAALSVVAVAAGLVTWLVVGASPYLFFASLLLAVLPWWRINQLRAARMEQFERQLPEALDLMARAMRAGHSFASAVRMCGDESPQPIGPVLRQFADELNYGMTFDEAVRRITRQIPVDEVSYFAVAVLIQRETGGNLVEILDKISSLIRQRIRLAGEIRVATSQGRLSA